MLLIPFLRFLSLMEGGTLVQRGIGYSWPFRQLAQGGLSSLPQQLTSVIVVVRALVEMIPGGSLLSIRSLHPYSCLWAGFTYKNDLIRLLVLSPSSYSSPICIYIYIYRQREEEEVMTGLMIIHFPKREAFYSNTNSWSIIHYTLNSLIKKKKKNSISAELDLNLVFLCIGFIKIMTRGQK